MSPPGPKNTPSPLPVHLALAGVSLIYGFFYVAVKLLLREIGEIPLIFVRFTFSAVLVGVVEWGYFKTRFANWQDFLKIAGLGLLGIFLVQNLVVMGVGRTTAFHASLLMATIPLMTMLWSMLLKREPFSPRKMAGILIAFAGVTLLLMNRHPGTPLPPDYLLGDVIILLSSLGFSWFLIGSQSLLKRYSSFSMMAYGYIVSALVYAGFFATRAPEPGLGFLGGVSTSGWILMAYIVLLASIGTYTLNNYALSRTGPSTVAVYIFAQPVLSAVFACFILNEPFTLNMALAGGITFGGMLLATRTVRETARV